MTLDESGTTYVFPLNITKSGLAAVSGEKWCWNSTTSCHHDYKAADIMAPMGTVVKAFVGGEVIKTTSSGPARLQIKGDDGNIYYYTHMLAGSIEAAGIKAGQTISAGTVLGKIGTTADGSGVQHLHIDALPPPYTGRMDCASEACSGYPFIDIQTVLHNLWIKLPE